MAKQPVEKTETRALPRVIDHGGIALAVILAVAALLRIEGLHWGLPNELHYFSYHPDESVVLMKSTHYLGGPDGLDFFHGKFLPGFYNYGSLQLYLVNIANIFASGYGYVGQVIGKTGAIDPIQWGHAYMAGRVVTVAMGIATVWVTYAIGRRLWGAAVGLLAAALLAVMPLHVQHSHFLTVDVPAAFWVALSLLWAIKAANPPPKPAEVKFEQGDDISATLRAVSAKPPSRFELGVWPFLFAGIFAGFAAATKYNSGLVIFAVLAAGHVRAYSASDENGETKRKLAGHTLCGVIAAGLAFLLTCPGAILEHAKFAADLALEKAHVYEQPEIYFQQTGPGWLYIIQHNLSAAMTWPVLIVALLGIVFGLYRRSRGDGLLAAFTLPYFIVIALATSRYARYEIPMLPILALWAARLLVEIGRVKLAGKVVYCFATSVMLVFAVITSLWYLAPMSKPLDTRDRLASEIIGEGTPPKSIGFASTPWFWTVPLNPYFSHPQPSFWTRDPFSSSTKVVAKLVWDPGKPFDVEQLKREQPDIVTMSIYEYSDRLRLNDPDATAYCAYLMQNYTIRTGYASLDKRPLRYPVWPDTLPASDIPHDMQYTNPITLVLYRKPLTGK